MGFLDSLKNFFRAEAAEAKDMIGDVTGAAERSIDAKQRDLDATPSEKMALLEEQMANSDSALEEIRQKVEGTLAKPEAEAELNESVRAAEEPAAEAPGAEPSEEPEAGGFAD